MPQLFHESGWNVTGCIVASRYETTAMKRVPEKKDVLIIDDETELCFLMKDILERRHFNVKVVNNLSDATGMLEENMPDIVFLDNNLPDGKGVDFIHVIKEENSNVKVVMMTSDTENNIQQKAIKEGASYFLFKPFTINNIYNILNVV